MFSPFCHGLLVFSLLLSTVYAIDIEYPHCNCDGDSDSLWSIENILHCQKIGDFLIAAAYFSIPLELLYFVSCSNVFPFKWVLFQFGAFIILCGLTHLLSVFMYEPHSFLVMLSQTIAKFLTALVSFATAITLLTLIPQLLRVKVRENFLRMKARELDKEVVLMKMQEEASWHVRMLTQEIRKSLDRHTILYTTLVELSKTLELQNCAVWMPNEDKTEMTLMYELRTRSSDAQILPVPMNVPDVCEINETSGTKILRPDSLLAYRSSGGVSEPGEVAAIRMPLLSVSNFKGGTPEIIQACYAILVLVLPRDDSRVWSCQELEIVEVIADQVAVALSHAAVLEESQLMRDKLVEQNRALQQARTEAMMASKARKLFQSVMSQGMRRPMHSISGFLSLMQQEHLGPEQWLITDSMAKTSSVTAKLFDNIMENPAVGTNSLALEIRPFLLCSTIKTVASIAQALCISKDFDFTIQVDNGLPDCVIGDEKRIIHVIMHMVGKLLNVSDGGCMNFQVHSDNQAQDGRDQVWAPWMSNFPEGYTSVKFEIGIRRSQNKSSSSATQLARTSIGGGVEMALGFNMCKKLVQMMHGNIWAISNSQGLVESMKLVLRLQLQSSRPVLGFNESSSEHYQPSNTLFEGLRVLLADSDSINRIVTKKLLEKIGCYVNSISTGLDCLSSLGGTQVPFDLVILDIDLHDIDGFEVALRIRKFRSRSWPLIVALTSSMQEDVRERCLQSGIIGLIQKPVMLQGIVDELRRILHKS